MFLLLSGLVGILPTAPILADEIPQGESGDAALPDGLTHAEWRHTQEQIRWADFGLTWRDTGATHAAPQSLSPTTLLIPQVAKLTASDGAAYDLFGNAIALDGNFFVVGAGCAYDNGDTPGSAYVLACNEGGPSHWGQDDKITPSDGNALAEFG
ncbi:MAG: FG-GAP repeat protein [Anaerolineae bacterium]|jgi:hypothetical protein